MPGLGKITPRYRFSPKSGSSQRKRRKARIRAEKAKDEILAAQLRQTLQEGLNALYPLLAAKRISLDEFSRIMQGVIADIVVMDRRGDKVFGPSA